MNQINNFRLISTMLIVFAFLAVSSCKKSDETPTDSKYPTIIERLNSVDYQNKVTAYWARNPFVRSDVNSFGFCAHTANSRELGTPGAYKEITPSQAKVIASNYIKLNPGETGITDTTGIGLTVTRQVVSGNAYVTYLQTREQMIDTLRIRYTTINIKIENEQVVEFVNNWFSPVYVPSEFFVSADKAINDLVGKEFSLPTIGGSVTGKVTQSDLTGATLETLIIQYPNPASVNTTQKLELRIVYKIYLPATWNFFYVDVMYGTLLYTDATIIS